MKVEITFYAQVGFLLIIKLLKKIEYISIAWLAVCTIISIYSNSIPCSNLLQTLFISVYCNLFIAGIMFYRLKQEIKSIKCHIIIAFCLLYQFAFNGIVSGSIVLVFFLLFYLMILNKLHFISIKTLKFLGLISYSLYLVHQNIGYIIIRELEGNEFLNSFTIIIPILCSIILAYLITKFIEKPVQGLALKKYIKYKNLEVSNASGIQKVST